MSRRVVSCKTVHYIRITEFGIKDVDKSNKKASPLKNLLELNTVKIRIYLLYC